MSASGDDALPQGEEKRRAVQDMFDTIAPRYDLVNRIMTFRMDVGWRRKAIQSLALAPRSLVLDLAAGTGDFSHALNKLGHDAVGIDLSYGMLAASPVEGPRIHADLLALPIADESADAAVCGFALRNLVSLEPFFIELHRVLRPGGTMALLDVSAPDNKVMRFGHGIYFNRIVPIIGGVISNRSAYQYLPKSVNYLPEPDVMLQMLRDVGFHSVARRQLSGGLSQLLTGTRGS